jgi:hypothetical protein
VNRKAKSANTKAKSALSTTRPILAISSNCLFFLDELIRDSKQRNG